MATAMCDQISSVVGGGTANPGLEGASQQNRSQQDKSAVRIRRFSFTIPASGPGSANGDVILLPAMKPTDRIYALRTYNPGLGAGVTLSVGKQDSNNSANTDPVHYLAATAAANAGILDANINMTEQVGADPSGASTDTGDAANAAAIGGGFGNGPIYPTLTIGGANPTAAQQIIGYYLYAGDQP